MKRQENVKTDGSINLKLAVPKYWEQRKGLIGKILQKQ